MARQLAWLYPRLQWIRQVVLRMVYEVVAHTRALRPNSVLMATSRDARLTGNLKFVADALDPAVYSIRCFSFATRPKSVIHRARADLGFIVAMAQTQFTVVDDFLPLVYPIRLRPGARLVQAWHAMGAFKRVGYSRRGRYGGPPATSITHKNYTDVIVSSEQVRADFAEAFGVDLARVVATGVPRSDLFFNPSACQRVRAQLWQRYPILRDKRIILFAPTFRGKGKRTAHYPATFADFAALAAALGPRDLLVIKMHPFVTAPTLVGGTPDNVIDLSDYPELNDLLLVTDLLVTDYSSAIFDFALLERPVVFYTPDLDAYLDQRGFSDPFADYAWGPVVRRFADLPGAIATAEVDQARLDQFKARFLNRCDGQATRRVIERIFAPTAAVRPVAGSVPPAGASAQVARSVPPAGAPAGKATPVPQGARQ
jgi:CDP-glycerol glycerophosphotransferase (TagB/SpsB family)